MSRGEDAAKPRIEVGAVLFEWKKRWWVVGGSESILGGWEGAGQD